MVHEVVKGNWKGLQGKLKQQFPELTDHDLSYQEGKEHEMIKMVAYKLHKTKDEMYGIIKNLPDGDQFNVQMKKTEHVLSMPLFF